MTVGNEMDHRGAWDSIPWLVNGTLPSDEEARLRAHMRRCPACAAEVADQERLATAVAALAPPASEATTHRRASAGPRDGRRPTPPRARRLRAVPWRGRGGPPMARVALGGGLAAGAMVAAVVLLPGSEYGTLTDAEPPAIGTSAVELRVRPAPDADPDRVRAALEAAGTAGIEGPSASGLLRAHVPVEARETTLAALRADPLFLVVAAD